MVWSGNALHTEHDWVNIIPNYKLWIRQKYIKQAS